MFSAGLRLAAIYLALSLRLAALALLQVVPWRPASWLGWTALLLLALPLSLLGEYVGQLLWTNRMSRSIEERTRGQAFSWARVAYALVVMVVVLGALIAATVAWRSFNGY